MSVYASLIFEILLQAVSLQSSSLPAEPKQSSETPSVICCGADEVFILPLTKDKPSLNDRTWVWRAADSPEIPADARTWFRTTDDCKLYGDEILITSSSGGVALVSREDKHCRFLAHVRNAHSACLLPDNRIAVASSVGGDEVVIYRIVPGEIGKSAEPGDPIARHPLPSAHGVVWDAQRNRLWALGYDTLQLLELNDADGELGIRMEQEWNLPTDGGHDLTDAQQGSLLLVTTESGVYHFDKSHSAFAPDAELGDAHDVKSIHEHPTTGRVVYHQANGENWWSDTIRFRDESHTIQLPGQRLYKVRWDAPQDRPADDRNFDPADFISCPENYFAKIAEEAARLWPANRRITFVAHGHSVPAGYFKTPEIRTFNAYPSLFHQQLAAANPTAMFEMIVTAIGGEESDSGAKRFAEDVLSLKPDVVLIDYSLNDRRLGLESAAAAWRSMIDACRENEVLVILLTPTPDKREDLLDETSPLAQHARQVRKLAAEYELPLVDSYAAFGSLVQQGHDVDEYMSQVNHPNRAGHMVVARVLAELFVKLELQ